MLNVSRFIQSLWVIPRGCAVDLAVDHNVVIARDPFPETIGMFVARAQEFHLHCIGREIVITLDDLASLALREYCTIPDGFRYNILLFPQSL